MGVDADATTASGKAIQHPQRASAACGSPPHLPAVLATTAQTSDTRLTAHRAHNLVWDNRRQLVPLPPPQPSAVPALPQPPHQAGLPGPQPWHQHPAPLPHRLQLQLQQQAQQRVHLMEPHHQGTLLTLLPLKQLLHQSPAVLAAAATVPAAAAGWPGKPQSCHRLLLLPLHPSWLLQWVQLVAGLPPGSCHAQQHLRRQPSWQPPPSLQIQQGTNTAAGTEVQGCWIR